MLSTIASPSVQAARSGCVGAVLLHHRLHVLDHLWSICALAGWCYAAVVLHVLCQSCGACALAGCCAAAVLHGLDHSCGACALVGCVLCYYCAPCSRSLVWWLCCGWVGDVLLLCSVFSVNRVVAVLLFVSSSSFLCHLRFSFGLGFS